MKKKKGSSSKKSGVKISEKAKGQLKDGYAKPKK